MSNDIIKVAFLIIIFAGTVLIPVNQITETSKTTTLHYEQGLDPWEYVKDRLFDGETTNVKKFQGPILIDLSMATHEDSLAVASVMRKISAILPNKEIAFFGKYIKENGLTHKESLELSANKVHLYFQKLTEEQRNSPKQTGAFTKLKDGNMVLSTKHKELRRVAPTQNNLKLKAHFGFNENIPDYRREKIIANELIGGLCFINNKEHKFFKTTSRGIGLVKQPDDAKEISPSIVELTIDAGENENSLFNLHALNDSSGISKYDIFLLQKLYADDFIPQFKAYLFKNYTWRYALNFTNSQLAKQIALSLIVSLCIIIFTLSFSLFSNKTFKYSYFNYALPGIVLVLAFTNLRLLYNYLTNINLVIGWHNYINGYQYLILVILSAFILWISDRYFIKDAFKFSTKLILKMTYTFFGIMIPVYVMLAVKTFFLKDIPISFLTILSVTFIITLTRGAILYANHLSDSLLKEKDIELSHLKELNAKAELKSLHAHINPHFLYNALNSIASLAPIDTKRTQEMAYSLSDLFKYTINREGKKMNTVSDEVTMVQNYLDIEKIRFGERLQFYVEVDKALENIEIPLFIIQPLVENAVKHGISKIEGKGEIILKIKKTNQGILITIEDNGPEFPDMLVSGHGLQTVYDLLRLSYGDNATLNWYNSPKKTISVTINLNN